MVLSNWKHELLGKRTTEGWGRGMTERDYYCLVNHVLDNVTLPSCEIFVGCHEDEPATPCCWVAVRDSEILFMYARKRFAEDPELAASLERTLLARLPMKAIKIRSFNPFLELRRERVKKPKPVPLEEPPMRVRLSTVLLINPVQFDRHDMPLSTLIASDEWRIEADYGNGRLSDVQIFRNANYRDEDATPEWSLYGAVPVAGVRGYRVISEQKAEPVPAQAPTDTARA